MKIVKILKPFGKNVCAIFLDKIGNMEMLPLLLPTIKSATESN